MASATLANLVKTLMFSIGSGDSSGQSFLARSTVAVKLHSFIPFHFKILISIAWAHQFLLTLVRASQRLAQIK